jgi:MFS family permease
MQMLKRLTDQFNFSGFPRPVWVVAATSCVMGLGVATSFIFLGLYLYQERHIPMTVVGLQSAIAGIVSGVFQILSGMAGDKFGYRRTALLFGLVGAITVIVLAALVAVKAPVWSIIVFMILQPALGAGTAPPLNAIVVKVTHNNRMTESFSLTWIAMNAAWVVGPLLGGFILGHSSFILLISIGAAFRTLAVLAIPFLPPDSQRAESNIPSKLDLKALIPNHAVFIFGSITVLYFLAQAQWGGTLSVFTVKRLNFSTQQYGFLLSITAAMIVIFQYPISRRMSKYTRKSLLLACACYAIGFLSLSWVKTFFPALGSLVIAVIGDMLFVPTALAVVGQLSTSEDRGKNMGFYGLCGTMGFSLGPLMGGFLLDRFPDNSLYLWGPISLCPLIAAIGFVVWSMKELSNEDTSKTCS